MNWDQIEGNWKQVKGRMHQQWGRLTDDEMDRIHGSREMLAGKIQEVYGLSREEAEKQVRQFNARCREDNWI